MDTGERKKGLKWSKIGILCTRVQRDSQEEKKYKDKTNLLTR